MVSRELGAAVLKQYYPNYQEAEYNRTDEGGLDFNHEIREIRLTADRRLAI
ncbi:MAG: hypothetical protein V1823_02320 [Chloroflexota bacterium]